MTIQSVPYALQNASHSAAVFRQAMSGPYSSGGVLSSSELAVSQQSTPNMSIVLGPGRAKVAGTQVSPPSSMQFTTQGMYDVLNDGAVTLTVTTSNPSNPRIDVVYVAVQDAYYSGSNNQAVAAVQAGTPAASPTVPAIPANGLALATIAVAANATSITSGNITQVSSTASLISSTAIHFGYLKTTSFNFGTTPSIHTWDSTPVYGTLAGFSTSDQRTFTCTTAGVYLIAASFSSNAGSAGINAVLYKNGATRYTGFAAATSSGDTSINLVATVTFAVGDTFDFYLASSATISGNYSNGSTFMTVDYLHA